MEKEVYLLRRLHAEPDGAGRAPSSPCTSTSPCRSPATCSRTPASCSSRSGATRSRRCGAGSGRRRAATASSRRRTSTSSATASCRSTTRSSSPLVIADALSALLPIGLPPFTIQVNNRKVAEGFYRGLGLDDVRRRAAHRRQARQDRRRTGRAGARRRDRRGRRAGAGVPGAGGDPVDGRLVRRPRPRARRRAPAARRGARRAGPRASRRAGEHVPGVLVADLRIARGLDYYTGTVYETTLDGLPRPRLDLLRRPLRRARQRRRNVVPGRRALDRRHPARGRPGRPRLLHGDALGADVRARRRAGRGRAPSATSSRGVLRPRGIADRGGADAPRSTASRSGTPTGAASRSSGSRRRGRRRGAATSAAASRCRRTPRLGAARRGSAIHAWSAEGDGAPNDEATGPPRGGGDRRARRPSRVTVDGFGLPFAA